MKREFHYEYNLSTITNIKTGSGEYNSVQETSLLIACMWMKTWFPMTVSSSSPLISNKTDSSFIFKTHVTSVTYFQLQISFFFKKTRIFKK